MTARTKWQISEVEALYELPFADLLHKAHTIHRQHFDANEIQISTLLSIKTGTCPEDCAYCPQSGHYATEVERQKLLTEEQVLEAAKQAKANGATRFCMGAGWRSPSDKDFAKVIPMVKAVKSLGLETCLTVGMLKEEQAKQLKQAGLDYYNHNLDTSPEYYEKIITTRCYQDRLDTLEHVRNADINVCCGGIVGMGETRHDRCSFLTQLANLPEPPQSVPINMLIPMKGTPLAEQKTLDPIEFVRTIAIARIMMPTSYVRLSAGRQSMSEEMHALCFYAGSNSFFYGDKLLVTDLPSQESDNQLMEKLGIKKQTTTGEACLSHD